ncbi:hypothetical protein M9H77_14455 [Catharanthus roseus]|uniref:Uncharacterized protein n=1 Tax=Catharanthus roseus TaxID=4058 RepID=A0ACC0BN72_CATRO|nr:hypothetical protein M9H77_14455 [Catharanthus roseus]
MTRSQNFMHKTLTTYCAIVRLESTEKKNDIQYQPNLLRALSSITFALSNHIKLGYKSWGTYQALVQGTSHIQYNPLTLLDAYNPIKNFVPRRIGFS